MQNAQFLLIYEADKLQPMLEVIYPALNVWEQGTLVMSVCDAKTVSTYGIDMHLHANAKLRQSRSVPVSALNVYRRVA